MLGRLRLSLSFAAVLTAGCIATAPVQQIREIAEPFDQELATRQLRHGPNTLRGNAFMRQQGGGVVTCAGRVVSLIPRTPYANGRIFAIYNTNEFGVSTSANFRFVPDLPEYHSNLRQAQCDSQGNFLFENVADGEFFVVTQITWQVGQALQGGNLMRKVTLVGGSITSIIMAP